MVKAAEVVEKNQISIDKNAVVDARPNEDCCLELPGSGKSPSSS